MPDFLELQPKQLEAANDIKTAEGPVTRHNG